MAWRENIGAATAAWRGRGGGLARTVEAMTRQWRGRSTVAGVSLPPEHRSRRRENGRERRNCRDRDKQSKEDKVEGDWGKTVTPGQKDGVRNLQS